MTQYVLKKYTDKMDPILCSVPDKQCWLRVGGAYDDSKWTSAANDRSKDQNGAHIFPIIQVINHLMRNWHHTAKAAAVLLLRVLW